MHVSLYNLALGTDGHFDVVVREQFAPAGASVHVTLSSVGSGFTIFFEAAPTSDPAQLRLGAARARQLARALEDLARRAEAAAQQLAEARRDAEAL